MQFLRSKINTTNPKIEFTCFQFMCALLLLVFLGGCASEYKALVPIETQQACAEKIKPQGLSTSWYHASIDVLDKHLSGLLLVKEMPDNSTRIVFTNEAGATFFDFEFSATGEFKPIHIIKQLDRKPVMNTFRKDFELMLGIPFMNSNLQSWREGDKLYYGVTRDKEVAYFTTNSDCTSLQQLELGSKRKRKVSITLSGDNPMAPDLITIKHYTFTMNIGLRKLHKE